MKITKRLLPLLIAALTVVGAAAQVQTPYSMYGYGIIGDRATSMQRQMGGIGYAMQSGRQINVMNPASYSAIDSLTFLFDFGADLSFIHSREGDTKKNTIGGGLDYITMQFPIADFLGGSLGLVPYSQVGYAFGNEIKHGAMENQGTGGITEAYLGLSGKIKGFSVGVNVSYNFGNIINDVYSTPDNSSQVLFKHIMEVRDWSVNIGAQYAQRIGRHGKMTVGATYSPKKTMHGHAMVTRQVVGSTTTADTLARVGIRDRYYQPTSVGAGLNYTYERRYKVMVEADFTYQNWKDALFSSIYDEQDQLLFQGMQFDNRYRYALGAEFIPQVRGSYLQRMSYRAGGFYTHDYINVKGFGVREYGLSCGLGLPTPEGKTMINIGFEWRHRGTASKDLLSENYFNITLGLNFNEVWFWQRKIK